MYKPSTAITTAAQSRGHKWALMLLCASSALSSSPLMAATNGLTQASGSPIWNWVIGFIVLSATLASAALSVAAYRNWQHQGWRAASILPIAVLAILLVLIAESGLSGRNSHGLWPLEVFAWSMINMIYMVGIMTTKRIFEKADASQAPN